MSPLRRNLRLGAFACLALDAALLVWLLSPGAPSRAAAQRQLDAARTQLIALRAENAQLARLSDRLHTSQEQIQELMAAGIPEESEASSKLLTEFSRIAGASQVRISGAEFNPDKNPRYGLRRIAITLQVAGGYGNVVRFLNQMERSPMFFLLTEVSVTGAPASAASSPAFAAPGATEVKLDLQLEAWARVAA